MQVIHANILQTAEFTCDNPTLNWLFSSCIRSLQGNMHCSVISDCLHRERLGYTGDTQATADTGMLLFDSKELYKKNIQDIAGCQDINSGHIQHTAPFYGGGGGPGGWGCALLQYPTITISILVIK